MVAEHDHGGETNIVYSLYDNHVAQLLDEAVYDSEHLRLGLTDRPSTTG